MKAYLEDFDPLTFDAKKYVQEQLGSDYPDLTKQDQQVRVIVKTRNDPLLFALIFRKSVLKYKGNVTMADMHADICRLARYLRNEIDLDNPLVFALIAPRNSGKSTWIFSVILIWAAAHLHRKFVSYIAATDTQCKAWMSNFKMAISKNKELRDHFPELVSPAKRPDTGFAFADNSFLYIAESGFTMTAFSLESKRLGLNISTEVEDDENRPDMMLFDDIEPPGASYTVAEIDKNRKLVEESFIPMGQPGCSVFFIGTVNCAGALMDQLRVAGSGGEVPDWIKALDVRIRHYWPFIDSEGVGQASSALAVRSFWPSRWSWEWLKSKERTRAFAVRFLNVPLPEDGAMWRDGDFKYATIQADEPYVCAIFIDPAMKTKKKSDFTAVAVIKYAPRVNVFEVAYADNFKLNPGTEMPQKVAEIISSFNGEITMLGIEDNQGGDLWETFYGNIPGVRYHQFGSSMNKVQRCGNVHFMYERGEVMHASPLHKLETEMYSFPNGLHDDLPDVVCTGILELGDIYGGFKTQKSREHRYA